MKHEVRIVETGFTYFCTSQESLLEAMCRVGLRGIPSGCRGGGCGVCKIEILAGDFKSKIMSKDHVNEDDLANQRLLACRVYPSSNLSLKVIGKLQKSVCKSTTYR